MLAYIYILYSHIFWNYTTIPLLHLGIFSKIGSQVKGYFRRDWSTQTLEFLLKLTSQHVTQGIHQHPKIQDPRKKNAHTVDKATVGIRRVWPEVILSAYVYMVRRPVGEAYWCAKGIQATLSSLDGSASSPFWQNVSIDLQISHYKGSGFVDLDHCIYALENSPLPKSSESDELSFVSSAHGTYMSYVI